MSASTGEASTWRKVAIVLAALLVVAAVGAAAKLHQRHQAREAACAEIEHLESHVASRREAAERGEPKVAFLGDSYTEGQHLRDALDAFPYVVASQLHVGALVDGEGGTGFVSGGPCGGDSYSTRIDDLVKQDPGAVVVQGGLNDTPDPPSPDAVSSVVSVAAAQSRPVVVVGPPYTKRVSDSSVDAVAEAMRKGAAKVGVRFVDLRPVHFEFLPDGQHVNAAGQAKIGALVARALAGAGFE